VKLCTGKQLLKFEGGTVKASLWVPLVVLLVSCNHGSRTDSTAMEAPKVSIKNEIEKRIAADMRERDRLIKLIKAGKIDEIPENSPVFAEDGSLRLKTLYSAQGWGEPKPKDVLDREDFKWDHLGWHNNEGYFEDYFEIHQDGSVSYPAFVGLEDYSILEDLFEGEYVYSLTSEKPETLEFKIFAEAPLTARLDFYYPELSSAKIKQVFDKAVDIARKEQISEDQPETPYPEGGRIATKLAETGYPLVNFAMPDYVGQNDLQIQGITFSINYQRSSRQFLSYIEGGNILIGVKDGERYALVGRDSIVMTQALISEQAGRKLTRDEVLKIIGKDYGIKPSRLFEISQPGDFHIDMFVSTAKNGRVVVNDGRKAYGMQVAWLNESQGESAEEWRTAFQKEPKQLIDFRIPFEDTIANELKKYGFEVVRVPGVFYLEMYNDEGTGGVDQRANFINNEKAIGPDGKSYAIFFDDEPGVFTDEIDGDAKNQVFEMIRKALSVDRIYPVRDNGQYLFGQGGASCIYKGEYELP
jgi:hypothetical protein